MRLMYGDTFLLRSPGQKPNIKLQTHLRLKAKEKLLFQVSLLQCQSFDTSHASNNKRYEYLDLTGRSPFEFKYVQIWPNLMPGVAEQSTNNPLILQD